MLPAASSSEGHDCLEHSARDRRAGAPRLRPPPREPPAASDHPLLGATRRGEQSAGACNTRSSESPFAENGAQERADAPSLGSARSWQRFEARSSLQLGAATCEVLIKSYCHCILTHAHVSLLAGTLTLNDYLLALDRRTVPPAAPARRTADGEPLRAAAGAEASPSLGGIGSWRCRGEGRPGRGRTRFHRPWWRLSIAQAVTSCSSRFFEVIHSYHLYCDGSLYT